LAAHTVGPAGGPLNGLDKQRSSLVPRRTKVESGELGKVGAGVIRDGDRQSTHV
jgi:hypothetical protein